jgi:quercetin dioxygenase-like cupin family protein
MATMNRCRLSVLTPRSIIPRHYHWLPYAAVVLSGGYEEAGDGGRRHVRPGDVLIQPAPRRSICARPASTRWCGA